MARSAAPASAQDEGFSLVNDVEDAFGLAIDADGNVLVSSITHAFEARLSRFTSGGAADETFAPGGEVITPVGDFAFPTAAATTSDNKILVFGTSDDDFMLIRYGVTDGGNTAPTVDPIGGSSSGVRQFGLTFTGSFSDPDAGDTHEVAWDFGDGNTIALHSSTDTGALTPTHTYTASGTFLVTFTVKDSAGNIVVSDALPVDIAATGIIEGNLLVGGTDGDDSIAVRDKVNGTFKVKFEGVVVATYNDSQIGQIIIAGGDGNDTLVVENDITKDAQIYGGNGDDELRGGGGNDLLVGGAGNDKLKARWANDILLGEAGSDTLAGGEGLDIMIGGLDADKIVGQDDSDILISGTTAHDGNYPALFAIRDEWTSAGTTADHVNNIRNGTGLTGGNKFLANVTVFDDAAHDTLAGGDGSDWFMANTTGSGVIDKITTLSSSDFVDDLDFIMS